MGVTCSGVHHSLLKRMEFDVCIIDEACQIVLPSMLGPMLLAQRFVLVGDPMQLPPIVSTERGRELKLDETLFSILKTANPEVKNWKSWIMHFA